MSCIYVLFSESTTKRYVGSSHRNDPTSRLRAHNNGKTRSTKKGRPWKILHSEEFKNYTEARKREIWLKTGVGRKFLDELLSHQSGGVG